jgi:hypothetical protein
MRDPQSVRAHLIEIDGSVTAGSLAFDWIFSRNRHRRETVEALALDFMDGLREIVGAGRNAQGGASMAEIFPDAGLASDDLDRLFSEASD